jgi:NAD(P)-dependent dehydrogenase (short-subunit alcohol dehydrogenase family)
VTSRGVAVVTGGGTGMGFASARALAAVRLDLVLAGRRAEVLKEAAQTIRADHPGCTVLTTAADVGSPAAAESITACAVENLGRLDVMVTAAAYYETVPILDMTVDQWDATIDVALRGTFLCAREAARHMKDHGGGRLVLFASANCVHSEPDAAHYDAAKAGVQSLTRSMAMEFAPLGITVNAVAPGWIRTAQSETAIQSAAPASFARINPLGRYGEPDEVADVVRYLAIESPTFLTGQMILIDGGQTVMAPMP